MTSAERFRSHTVQDRTDREVSEEAHVYIAGALLGRTRLVVQFRKITPLKYCALSILLLTSQAS